VNVAAVPLNVTAVAPMKFVPLIVTLVPTGPLAGVKLAIVGAMPVRNAFRMFAVICWMRASTLNCRSTPGASSSAQAHEIVPAPNTHAPLGAWYIEEFAYVVTPLPGSVKGDRESSVWFAVFGGG
jgi:hypothetical protein